MAAVNPISLALDEQHACDRMDVRSELFNNRVLMLDGPINLKMGSQLIANLLVLENKNPEAPITLLISGPGGDVYSGLGLIDVMHDISCPIYTVGYGLVASMSSVILACGDSRSVYPNTHVLLHQLMAGAGISQQSDIDIIAGHVSMLRERLDSLLAGRIALSKDEIHRLTDRDCWCNAQDAVRLGIVDRIIGFD